MDPKKSVATSEGKEEEAGSIKIALHDETTDLVQKMVSFEITDDVKDEDLDDAVDKTCKRILDYVSLLREAPFKEPYIINKSRLDTQGSWSSSSPFLAFSEKYKSKFDSFMESYLRAGVYPIKDVLPDYGAKSFPISMPGDEHVLRRYKNFKRFDTVVDFSDHLFSTSPIAETIYWWDERMHRERKILEKDLPETIFVRAYKSRMDLLRAVIVGPKGTPYDDGLFFFDMYFPPTYPLQPPLVRYHSAGFGINPHMLECGEVCLDLTGTKTFMNQYVTEQIWQSVNTNVLQLLVSIQERVLNADPLFHQPGLQDSGPSVVAEYFSLLYNEYVLIKSLKTMMHLMNKPPKNFEDLVVGHFCNRAPDILKACGAYMEGVQVGCVVGNKERCCSFGFRSDVALCVAGLVSCFKSIGATNANIFIHSLPGSFIIHKPELLSTSASASGQAVLYRFALDEETDHARRAVFDEIALNDEPVTLNKVKAFMVSTCSDPKVHVY